MYTPHPAMKEKLRRDLEESRWIQRPMPIHWDETRDEQCAGKKVLRSRSLHDMGSLEHWEAMTYADLSVSQEHTFAPNSSAIRFTAPCKLEKWTGRVGRIYCVPKAFLHIDREDWTSWNRLTAWVYPDMPGYRNVCVRLQLHNDGEHKVPDAFDREGGHNLNLLNHRWNRIQFEIPYVARDAVIGVSFDYDMVGHEPCASGRAVWYIGALMLEEVEDPEPYEGWDTAPGRIAYSHLGYQPGARKTAIASRLDAETFSLVDDATGEVVLTAPVEHVTTTTGTFCVMDFTDWVQSGSYRLRAGSSETERFDIDEYIWMDSAWKTINFIFSQRCGYRVPGKHDACHTDQRTRHGDKEIIANGGWHDAADTNQQIQLTCEAVHSLFELSMKLRKEDPLLAQRLLDEGTWGLSYLLKGRFGDGYRTGPSSSAVWTDGIRGTCDDLTFDAVNAPFANLLAASAEIMGHLALYPEDEVLSDWALRCAIEDYHFGQTMLDDPSFDPAVIYPGHDKMVSRCLMASIAALTAMELYEVTHDPQYAEDGARYGDYIIACQERRNNPSFSVPLTGFFYRDSRHKTVIHYNHRSQEDKTTLALIALCRLLPHHPHWMQWQSGLMYYMDYIKKSMMATAPYGMLPSGIYSREEIDDRDTFSLMHPIFAMFAGKDEEGQKAETFLHYTDQLDTGVPLDEKHALRRFPVWYSFRGNYHVTLSLGKAVSAASVYLHDWELYNIAQEQLAWIIGKNPFCESMMFGTGHQYGTQYAVLHGDTVGELPVGMQSNEERDAPFWPQANNCTYKEVWMGPPGKWLAILADEYLPGRVTGRFPDGEIILTHKSTGEVTRLTPVDGTLDAALHAGEYEASFQGQSCSMTVVSGCVCVLPYPLSSPTLTAALEGEAVHLTLTGSGSYELICDNLLLKQDTVSLSKTPLDLTVPLIDRLAPWAVVLRREDGTVLASAQG